MRCPNCWGQLLTIEVKFQGFVTMFFHAADEYRLTEPISLNSQWEDESPCMCQECDWSGNVGEALASCESAAWTVEEE